MTGIEVAGIVLAIFPLCISALEHCKSATDAVETFWEIRREYKDWKLDLQFYQTAFEQNLEQCLLPLVTDEDELLRLIASPSDPGWKDAKLEARLKSRLPKSYDQFIERMQKIECIVSKLRDELGIAVDSFQKRVVEPKTTLREKLRTKSIDNTFKKSNIKFQTQRLKMALGRAKRIELFEEFADCNNKLLSMLEAGDRIAALRSDRKAAKNSPIIGELNKFRSHANSLYQVLCRAWRCNCREFHHGNLRLQHRTFCMTNFEVTFLSTRKIGTNPWNWQETHIKVVEKGEQTLNIGNVSEASSNRLKKAALSYSSPSHKMPTRRSASNPQSTSLGTLLNTGQGSAALNKMVVRRKPLPKSRVTFSIEDGPQSTPIPPGLVPINDLCEAMATCQPCYLGDESCNFYVHPSLPEGEKAEIPETITLETLLSKDNSSPLSRLERYYIAVTLASSQIQLHSTPWISSFWSKKDIVFLKSASNSSQVQLNKLYISRDFSIPPNAEPSLRDTDSSLCNLGIMLLELCFGRTLEDRQIEKGYPKFEAHKEYLALAAALQWFPRASEEAGPEFADAICWCLCKMPGSSDSYGKVGRWREEFLANVLEPLQYCYETLKNVRERGRAIDQSW